MKILKIFILFLTTQVLISNNLEKKSFKSFDVNNAYNYQYNIPKQNNKIKLASNIDNSSYILGPSDEIFINLNANNLHLNNIFSVSPSGDIIIPNLGMINVNGITINEAINEIQELCREKYDKFELNITLVNIREFIVSVFGIQKIPNSIIVNPTMRISDLFNIYLTKINNYKEIISDRYIYLHRLDSTYQIDVLKKNILGEGFDPYLIENDKIELTYKSDVVTIEGAINYPGKYEFVNEETIEDLIKLAGGLRGNDISLNIILNRQLDNENKQYILNFNNDKNFKLYKNDFIIIPLNNLNKRKFSFINGAVKYPGKYVINDSMTVYDLIQLAGGYLDSADNNKISVNNEYLAKELDKEYVRISNILPQNRSSSEISYMKSRNIINKGSLLSVDENLTMIISKYIIKENDIIFIPEILNNIELIGAVKSPGTYNYNTNKDIDYYIQNGGGETINSSKMYYVIDNYGVKNKVKLNFNEIKPGNIIFVEQKQDYNFWNKFKELMGVAGQIATLIAVIQSAQN